MKLALASVVAISLTGCAMTTSENEPATPPEVGEAACNIDALSGLVGQPGTSELAADAMAKSGARSVRWIRPGMAVTMDFRPDRLNIELDDSSNVVKFGCG